MIKNIVHCNTREEWLAKRQSYDGDVLYNASEISAYIGDNPYKSAYTAWLEKTGQKAPEDLSSNENIQRGIEREPYIREHFIEENKKWLLTTYKPFDIYVAKCKNYTIGATLDLEGVVLEENNPYKLPVGARVIVEFKSVLVTPQTFTEDNWKHNPPVYYIEQQYGQLMATLYTANILCAEFRHEQEGQEPWNEYITYSPVIIDPLMLYDDSNVKGIDERLQKFVQCVKTKTAPAKNVQGSNTEIVFTADYSKAIVSSNKEEVIALITQELAFVETLEITEENEKEMREIRARINKMITSINQRRLEVKRELEKPIKQWDSDVKEITAVGDKALAFMDEHLKAIEDKRIENKKLFINGVISAEITASFVGQDGLLEYFNQCGGVIYDSRWENKGSANNAIKKDIKAQIQQFMEDFQVLSGFDSDSEIYNAMLRAYKVRRSLLDATEACRDVENTRRIAAQAKQEQAMKSLFKEPKESPRPEVETPVNTQPSLPSSEQLYTVGFTMFHVSRDDLANLSEYFRNNKISYKRTFYTKEN